jgi:uncharacterized phage protein (TIGR02218 family)
MKTITEDLKNHLAGEVTMLATCWKIARRDGTVMGFTDCDKDLVISGVIYKAATGFTPTAVQSSAGLAVDNLDVEGMLDSSAISEAELMAGLYDFAEVEVFMVNYEELAQGKLQLRTGWLGEVRLARNQFIAEVRGLAQRLNQKIGDVFSSTCRASFADAKCGKNAASYKVSKTVIAVTTNQIFNAALTQVTGYYNYGVVKFTSGANAGLSMEVKEYIKDVSVTLVLPLPYAIEAGDAFEIVAGCDKNFKTCIEKFNNAVNYRGEPHVPGLDAIMKTAGTR